MKDAKFERDLLKTNDDIATQSRRIYRALYGVGASSWPPPQKRL